MFTKLKCYNLLETVTLICDIISISLKCRSFQFKPDFVRGVAREGGGGGTWHQQKGTYYTEYAWSGILCKAGGSGGIIPEKTFVFFYP
jgi:hypothetical protein